jgi:hypothetical protein
MPAQKPKTTSPKVAGEAGQLLGKPKSPNKVKSVAGSALGQAKPKPKAKPRGK